MSTLLYTTLDGISYALNAHYEVVTTLLYWAYTSVVALRDIISGIYSGVRQTCDVTVTLVLDTIEVVIHGAKLVIFVAVKFVDFALLVLSWIEAFVLQVSQTKSRTTQPLSV